jgi:hypothetical protein
MLLSGLVVCVNADGTGDITINIGSEQGYEHALYGVGDSRTSMQADYVLLSKYAACFIYGNLTNAGKNIELPAGKYDVYIIKSG